MATPRTAAAGRVATKSEPYPFVSWPYRAVFYGICSFYLEVVWTAIYELVESGNVKLRGYSSIWSLFIYGVSCTCLERLYFSLRGRGYSMPIRGIAYMCSTFVVELIAGLLLQPWKANSWDYSKQFTYHYKGAIALEYAPLWFISGILFEYQIDVCNRFLWKSAGDDNSTAKRRDLNGKGPVQS